jgi:hypothetical protein
LADVSRVEPWLAFAGQDAVAPALMLIDPYPWSAPLEEVRLKKK